MKLYKGFDDQLRCRGFQYEVGGEYETDKASMCSVGFHACENPLDVMSYYPPIGSRYCVVELEGLSEERRTEDTKRVATKIKIVKELDQAEWFAECQKYLAEHTGVAQASGDSGHAQASGDSGHAQASGRSGHAQASGYSGHAQASGYMGHAQASGDMGHAQASGYMGHAQASGYMGHAQASGDMGHAQASGYASVAVSLGYYGTARASGNCQFVVLGDWRKNSDGILHLKNVLVGHVGEEIKADVSYRIEEGKFIDVE